MPREKLDQRKSYAVERIGPSNDKVTCGEVYIVHYTNSFRHYYRWTILETDRPNTTTQPALVQGSSCWRVLHSTDKSHTVHAEPTLDEGEFYDDVDPTDLITDEEAPMTTFSTATSGRIINGNAATDYSDDEIIEFIRDQRVKLAILEEDAIDTPKYLKSKSGVINKYLTILKAELESRA